MRIHTDDELYRVDRVYLGPKGRRVPWRATYRAYGVWLVMVLLIGFVTFQIFPINASTVAAAFFSSIFLTIHVMKRLDSDRPLVTLPVMGWHELTAQRPQPQRHERHIVKLRIQRWPAGAEPRRRWWQRNREEH